jgi:hypothetical protein
MALVLYSVGAHDDVSVLWGKFAGGMSESKRGIVQNIEAHTRDEYGAVSVGALFEVLRETIEADIVRDIRHVKQAVRGWDATANEIRAERLLPFLRDGMTPEEIRALLSVDIFDGLATSYKEFARAKQNTPYIEPRVVHLGGKDEVISFDMASLLLRKLVHDAAFRKTCESRSRVWKLGEHWQVSPQADDMLDDFDSAVGARFHDELMRPATKDEEHDLRVPLLFNCDDIEVVRIPSPCIRGTLPD